MFNIIYNDNLSINDIIKLQENGLSFIRSAHVGNWNKQTLMLGKLNVHILMHEFLKGDAKIYEPAYIKFKNKKKKLSKNDNVLQLYDNTFIYSEKSKFTKPSNFHYDSLKKIYGENIEIISSYFLKHVFLIKRILKIIVPEFSSELYKYIDENGNVYVFNEKHKNGDLEYKCNNMVKVIPKKQIISEIFNLFESTSLCLCFHNNINPSGILISSKLYILLTCLCEYFNIKESNNSLDAVDVYHFSGTQMVNYLIKNSQMSFENRSFFEKAYKLICESLVGVFPNQMNFNLIPTDCFQFVCCLKSGDTEKIESIYELYKMIQNLKLVKDNIKSEFITKEYNRIILLEDSELLQLFENISGLIGKRKYNKLKYLFMNGKKSEKGKLSSELANLLCRYNNVISDKIQIINNIINNLEKELQNKISNNLSLFFDEITQYDLLFYSDDIYLAKQSCNMKIRDLKKLVKIIINVKNNNKDL